MRVAVFLIDLLDAVGQLDRLAGQHRDVDVQTEGVIFPIRFGRVRQDEGIGAAVGLAEAVGVLSKAGDRPRLSAHSERQVLGVVDKVKVVTPTVVGAGAHLVDDIRAGIHEVGDLVGQVGEGIPQIVAVVMGSDLSSPSQELLRKGI